MAITIKDVAKETNLAISTISKYINGGNVREKNRIIIQQAIEKLGYIPNDTARSLRTSKSYLIGIMEGYIHSAHQSVIVGEIEKKLREKGYSLLFAGKDMEDGQAIRFAIENACDGLIICPANSDRQYIPLLKEKNIPAVLLEENWIGTELDCVQTDAATSSYELVEHLVKSGHSDIGIINGPPYRGTASERLRGYKRVMEDYAMPLRKEFIIECEFRFEDGYRAMKQLWNLEKRPTAVFATSYDLAQGMMAAIHEMKLKVPEEVSIVVFDDFDLSTLVKPQLTAVSQPLIKLADTACDILMRRIQNGWPEQRKVVRIKSQINYRDSVMDISGGA